MQLKNGCTAAHVKGRLQPLNESRIDSFFTDTPCTDEVNAEVYGIGEILACGQIVLVTAYLYRWAGPGLRW